ncbi:MAG: bifunctional folylpolyglutamate synthase/dihydrofolate synthase [Truepera sp.]|nr:bifunctional folylpolyglutamate synthase/dihydrofolate synthase [Truepera sp.]
MTSNSDFAWLFARQRFGVQPGLSRIAALLAALANPERRFESVLVGGTNGKGSTSAALYAILLAAGRRAGLFTSPHLTSFRERFLVGGEMLPDEAVAAALARLRGPAEEIGATFFEIVTAIGCLLFAEAGVELAVMEVGLGGRFDATNVLDPRLSVITGVSLDHTEILGDTVEQIAVEKAGIMRTGKLCLSGAEGGALAVLQDQAKAFGTTLLTLAELALTICPKGWRGVAVTLTSPWGELSASSPLIGTHQGRNAALAMVAAQALGIDAATIQRGLAQTRWPGRLEPLSYQERTFLLDGAHNPEGAIRLAETVQALQVAPLPLIVAASADKDLAAIAAALGRVASQVIVTRARLSPRYCDPSTLAAHFTVPVTISQSPAEALTQALRLTAPGDTLLVAGSLYLVGELRPLLLGVPGEGWERWQ